MLAKIAMTVSCLQKYSILKGLNWRSCNCNSLKIKVIPYY